MLNRRGFGASEAIGAIVALGAAGLVGYSMLSGECLLGGCDAGSASSAAIPATATVVGTEGVDGSGCSLEGCEDSEILAIGDAPDANLTLVKAAGHEGSDCCEVDASSEPDKGTCLSECSGEDETPLD